MWDDLGVEQLTGEVLSRGAAAILGVTVVYAAAASLMRTVVIPRALRSIISSAVARTVTGTYLILSRMRRTYRARDAVLAWAGPTTIIMQLLTWLVLFLLGYGLLIYGVSGLPLGESLRQAGSSLFTLGFAAVDSENQTIIDFFAAATGPIVIALLIGFLPTIYAAYIEREVDVTLLSVTGGEPAWGPELLARHALGHDIDGLRTAFAEWTRWAAQLRLTHVTYPVLVWVRSARANRHYITSLLAVMDAAALQLSLNTSLPRREAYSALLQGGQALEVLYVFLFSRTPWHRSIPFAGRFFGQSDQSRRDAQALPTWDRHVLATQIAASLDSARWFDGAAARALAEGEEQPLRITRDEFDMAVDVLRRSHFPIETDLDQAWEEFRIARSRYEYAALAIAKAVDASPAPWSGPRRIPTEVIWPTLVCDVIPPRSGGEKADDPHESDGAAGGA